MFKLINPSRHDSKADYGNSDDASRVFVYLFSDIGSKMAGLLVIPEADIFDRYFAFWPQFY